MRKFLKVVATISGAGIAVILLCYGALQLIFGHYHYPNKSPCHPLEYPSLEPKHILPWNEREWSEVFEYQTEKLVNEVVEDIDNKLDAIILSSEETLWLAGPDVWKHKEISGRIHVYQCISASNSLGFFSEQGCMYVKETPQWTLIQAQLIFFETSTWSCDSPNLMP